MTETTTDCDRKMADLRKHVPFIEETIRHLRGAKEKSRLAQLSKLESLHAMLTDAHRKWKYPVLLRCEELIVKLKNGTKPDVYADRSVSTEGEGDGKKSPEEIPGSKPRPNPPPGSKAPEDAGRVVPKRAETSTGNGSDKNLHGHAKIGPVKSPAKDSGLLRTTDIKKTRLPSPGNPESSAKPTSRGIPAKGNLQVLDEVGSVKKSIRKDTGSPSTGRGNPETSTTSTSTVSKGIPAKGNLQGHAKIGPVKSSATDIKKTPLLGRGNPTSSLTPTSAASRGIPAKRNLQDRDEIGSVESVRKESGSHSTNRGNPETPTTSTSTVSQGIPAKGNLQGLVKIGPVKSSAKDSGLLATTDIKKTPLPVRGNPASSTTSTAAASRGIPPKRNLRDRDEVGSVESIRKDSGSHSTNRGNPETSTASTSTVSKGIPAKENLQKHGKVGPLESDRKNPEISGQIIPVVTSYRKAPNRSTRTPVVWRECIREQNHVIPEACEDRTAVGNPTGHERVAPRDSKLLVVVVPENGQVSTKQGRLQDSERTALAESPRAVSQTPSPAPLPKDFKSLNVVLPENGEDSSKLGNSRDSKRTVLAESPRAVSKTSPRIAFAIGSKSLNVVLPENGEDSSKLGNLQDSERTVLAGSPRTVSKTSPRIAFPIGSKSLNVVLPENGEDSSKLGNLHDPKRTVLAESPRAVSKTSPRIAFPIGSKSLHVVLPEYGEDSTKRERLPDSGRTAVTDLTQEAWPTSRTVRFPKQFKIFNNVLPEDGEDLTKRGRSRDSERTTFVELTQEAWPTSPALPFRKQFKSLNDVLPEDEDLTKRENFQDSERNFNLLNAVPSEDGEDSTNRGNFEGCKVILREGSKRLTAKSATMGQRLTEEGRLKGFEKAAPVESAWKHWTSFRAILAEGGENLTIPAVSKDTRKFEGQRQKTTKTSEVSRRKPAVAMVTIGDQGPKSMIVTEMIDGHGRKSMVAMETNDAQERHSMVTMETSDGQGQQSMVTMETGDGQEQQSMVTMENNDAQGQKSMVTMETSDGQGQQSMVTTENNDARGQKSMVTMETSDVNAQKSTVTMDTNDGYEQRGYSSTSPYIRNIKTEPVATVEIGESSSGTSKINFHQKQLVGVLKSENPDLIPPSRTCTSVEILDFIVKNYKQIKRMFDTDDSEDGGGESRPGRRRRKKKKRKHKRRYSPSESSDDSDHRKRKKSAKQEIGVGEILEEKSAKTEEGENPRCDVTNLQKTETPDESTSAQTEMEISRVKLPVGKKRGKKPDRTAEIQDHQEVDAKDGVSRRIGLRSNPSHVTSDQAEARPSNGSDEDAGGTGRRTRSKSRSIVQRNQGHEEANRGEHPRSISASARDDQEVGGGRKSREARDAGGGRTLPVTPSRGENLNKRPRSSVDDGQEAAVRQLRSNSCHVTSDPAKIQSSKVSDDEVGGKGRRTRSKSRSNAWRDQGHEEANGCERPRSNDASAQDDEGRTSVQGRMLPVPSLSEGNLSESPRSSAGRSSRKSAETLDAEEERTLPVSPFREGKRPRSSAKSVNDEQGVAGRSSRKSPETFDAEEGRTLPVSPFREGKRPRSSAKSVNDEQGVAGRSSRKSPETFDAEEGRTLPVSSFREGKRPRSIAKPVKDEHEVAAHSSRKSPKTFDAEEGRKLTVSPTREGHLSKSRSSVKSVNDGQEVATEEGDCHLDGTNARKPLEMKPPDRVNAELGEIRTPPTGSLKKRRKKEVEVALLQDTGSDRSRDVPYDFRKHSKISNPAPSCVMRATRGHHREGYYVIDKRTSCELCQYDGSDISFHYKTVHPESEVLTSRLSPCAAEMAISRCKGGVYENVSVSSRRSKFHRYACPFCDIIVWEVAAKFYDHLAEHTGEFKYGCGSCGYATDKLSEMDHHQDETHDGDRKLRLKAPPSDSDVVLGFLCSDCNYVQTAEEDLERHVELYHKEKGAEIFKIDLNFIGLREEVKEKRAEPKRDAENIGTTMIEKSKRGRAGSNSTVISEWDEMEDKGGARLEELRNPAQIRGSISEIAPPRIDGGGDQHQFPLNGGEQSRSSSSNADQSPHLPSGRGLAALKRADLIDKSLPRDENLFVEDKSPPPPSGRDLTELEREELTDESPPSNENLFAEGQFPSSPNGRGLTPLNRKDLADESPPSNENLFAEGQSLHLPGGRSLTSEDQPLPSLKEEHLTDEDESSNEKSYYIIPSPLQSPPNEIDSADEKHPPSSSNNDDFGDTEVGVILQVGLIELLRCHSGRVSYGCLVPGCSFCSEDERIFGTHCRTKHASIASTDWLCNKCGINFPNIALYELFLHVSRVHSPRCSKMSRAAQEQNSDAFPNVSSKPRHQVASANGAVVERWAVNRSHLPTEEPPSPPKYQFVIADVRSLARGSDNSDCLPPTAPSMGEVDDVQAGCGAKFDEIVAGPSRSSAPIFVITDVRSLAGKSATFDCLSPTAPSIDDVQTSVSGKCAEVDDIGASSSCSSALPFVITDVRSLAAQPENSDCLSPTTPSTVEVDDSRREGAESDDGVAGSSRSSAPPFVITDVRSLAGTSDNFDCLSPTAPSTVKLNVRKRSRRKGPSRISAPSFVIADVRSLATKSDGLNCLPPTAPSTVKLDDVQPGSMRKRANFDDGVAASIRSSAPPLVAANTRSLSRKSDTTDCLSPTAPSTVKLDDVQASESSRKGDLVAPSTNARSLLRKSSINCSPPPAPSTVKLGDVQPPSMRKEDVVAGPSGTSAPPSVAANRRSLSRKSDTIDCLSPTAPSTVKLDDVQTSGSSRVGAFEFVVFNSSLLTEDTEIASNSPEVTMNCDFSSSVTSPGAPVGKWEEKDETLPSTNVTTSTCSGSNTFEDDDNPELDRNASEFVEEGEEEPPTTEDQADAAEVVFCKCPVFGCHFSTYDRSDLFGHTLRHGNRYIGCLYCDKVPRLWQYTSHIIDKHCPLLAVPTPSRILPRLRPGKYPPLAELVKPYRWVQDGCTFKTIFTDWIPKYREERGEVSCGYCSAPLEEDVEGHFASHNIHPHHCPYCRFGASKANRVVRHMSECHDDLPFGLLTRFVSKNLPARDDEYHQLSFLSDELIAARTSEMGVDTKRRDPPAKLRFPTATPVGEKESAGTAPRRRRQFRTAPEYKCAEDTTSASETEDVLQELIAADPKDAGGGPSETDLERKRDDLSTVNDEVVFVDVIADRTTEEMDADAGLVAPEEYRVKCTWRRCYKCPICRCIIKGANKFYDHLTEEGGSIRREYLDGATEEGDHQLRQLLENIIRYQTRIMYYWLDSYDSCRFCSKTFYSSNPHYLISHEWRHLDGAQSFRCPLCQTDFFAEGLFLHLHKTHWSNPPTVPPKSIAPILIRSTYKPKQDDLFLIRTMTHSDLEGLRRYPIDRSPKTCAICLYEGSYREQVAHYAEEHPGKEVLGFVFRCTICRKYFDLARLFRVHNRERHASEAKASPTYVGVIREKCTVCGERFDDRTVLKSHFRTHTEPYMCQHCDHRTYNLRSLRKHYCERHEGESFDFLFDFAAEKVGRTRRIDEVE